MIRFGNELSRIKLPENFDKDIKKGPDTRYSFEEASGYWDNVFLNVRDEDSERINFDDIDEDQIKRDVYGRDESEFSFEDFDLEDSEIDECLNMFSFYRWRLMDEQEKKENIERFAKVIGMKLELDNPPDVGFYRADPCECGYYDPDRGLIMINVENYDNSAEIVDTIAHELRHAYQFERSLKLETYTDLLYAYNFKNYISPVQILGFYVGFTDYQEQFIEAEARAFASNFEVA